MEVEREKRPAVTTREGTMSIIKKAWTNLLHPRSEHHVLCIRFNPGVQVHASVQELPPAEEINGKKMNFTDAQAQGLTENHIILSSFTTDEMRELATVLTGLADSLDGV